MANDKRFVAKNGLQSQNIDFVSPDDTKNITITMLDSGVVSFNGDSGQLFSISDTMSGTIFAVNDVSGVPSIEVDATGTIRFAETFGNILIGTATDNATDKLQVNGSITSTVLKSTVAVGTAPLTVTSTTRVSNLNVATAGTADVLTTARTINGVSFNGSANITIPSNTTNALTIGTGLSGTSFNGSAAVTIAIDSTVATLTGTQTLTNKTISGASNTLSNIANASLTNSSVTVGTTAIALGASSTTLVGLTSVTSTTFVGALTGNASTATTLQTARNINGTSFNGSADITITAANPNALTIGTGLSGTSYTGSAAITIALASGYGDTLNPYASKTANFVLAAPNGVAGVPTFRAIVAADIPTLNQNTTGTAANVTGTVAVANGGTGVTTSTGTGSVVLSASPTFTGTISAASLTLSGDLTINGTTTTVNSTTLTVDDKNIELGSVTTPTNATADGGGITLKGATDKTFNWVSATAAWTSSENIALAAGKDIILNGLTSGSVTLVVPDVSGTNTVTIPAITGTVITTADTGTVTNTMLAGSIANAKLTNSSVTVGTTAIALGASSTTLAGLTSVTSTTFVGALTGNASTATSAATLTTARNINGVSFNGSADITITAANPNALTIGTGLSGTSYNGSSAVTIALAAAHGDTTNPYASKTANFFLAAPNGAAGAPTFRAIVAADIPTLNQNTTGSAGSAPAGTLTGATLASGVTASSLTSVGTITSGTWSGSFGAVSGANLTSLTAGNLSGTIPSAVLGNSVHFIGTTSIALNRASAAQTLTGVSIDGTAGGETLATVTNRGAATTSSIYLPSGEGTAYGFWGGTTTYSIAMGTTAGTYQYGPVTDYSIKTNMAGGIGRGFTWGQFGVKPIAALNSTSGDMQIAGTFSAASKSFLIPHPTKEGMQLRHGSLEGPENGVYIRGKLKDNNTIELPEYWTKLVDPDSITVSLTSIGKHQDLYVESIDIDKIVVGNGNLINRSINCFFVVYGERIDIAKLVVESD